MRKHWWKNIFLGIGVIIMMTTQTGCSVRRRAEEELQEFMDLHPTEDLRDFFDMEGERSAASGFEKDDLGTWVIRTSISDGNYIEEVTLHLNRNTREGRGHYVLSRWEEGKAHPVEEKHHEIYLDEKDLRLVHEIDDQKLRERIETFRFLVQLVSLDSEFLDSLRLKDAWTSTAPTFGLAFQIPKDNETLRKVLEVFDIEINPSSSKEMIVRRLGQGGFRPHIQKDLSFVFRNDGDRKTVHSFIVFERTKN